MVQSIKVIEARASALAERIARTTASLKDVEAEITRDALADKPLNGALHKRSELHAKGAALTKERDRLIAEELPIAEAAEAAAERLKHLKAAQAAHETIVKRAGEVDVALARANVALAQLRDAWPEYAATLRLAGAAGKEPNWRKSLERALWAARSPMRRFNPWRGQAGAPRPIIALELALPTELKHHAQPLAEQLAKFAPSDAAKARPKEGGPRGLLSAVETEALNARLTAEGDQRQASAERKAEYAAREMKDFNNGGPEPNRLWDKPLSPEQVGERQKAKAAKRAEVRQA